MSEALRASVGAMGNGVWGMEYGGWKMEGDFGPLRGLGRCKLITMGGFLFGE